MLDALERAPLKGSRPHDVAAAYAKAHMKRFKGPGAMSMIPIPHVWMRNLDGLRAVVEGGENRCPLCEAMLQVAVDPTARVTQFQSNDQGIPAWPAFVRRQLKHGIWMV